MNDFSFRFHPLKSGFVDPECAPHAGENLRFLIRWAVAWTSCRFQNIEVTRVLNGLARQLKDKGLGQLLNHPVIAVPVPLIFGDAFLSFFLRFTTSLCDNVI